MSQYITTTALNLRQAPSTKAKIVKVIPKKQVVVKLSTPPIIYGGYEWANINWQANAGWVASRYLKPYSAPVPNQSGNKIGLHVISDAKRETFFDLLRRVDIPVITLTKLGWDKEITCNEIKSVRANCKVMLRDYHKGEPGDNVFVRTDSAIRSYVNWHLCCGDNADYYQIINEPSFQEPVPVANFWSVAIDEANKQGKKLGVFCFSERNPNMQFWRHSDIQAVLKKADIYGHCFMRHNYVIDLQGNQGTCFNWAKTPYQADKLYRHQQDIAAFPYTAQSIPVWIGELGDINLLRCNKEHLRQQVRAFKAGIQYDNVNLVGACLWTAGTAASKLWENDNILDWYEYAVG